ncbi:hypothetical protein Pelo_18583 [Pelomyxa schiedti]|nr:hypothetical protein Pelo_18583 [Pelomyxa schiedti]
MLAPAPAHLGVMGENTGGTVGGAEEFVVCGDNAAKWAQLCEDAKALAKSRRQENKKLAKAAKPEHRRDATHCFDEVSQLSIPTEKQVPWTILVLDLIKESWGTELRTFFSQLPKVSVFPLPVSSSEALEYLEEECEDSSIPVDSVNVVIVNGHGKDLYYGEARKRREKKNSTDSEEHIPGPPCSTLWQCLPVHI